MNIPANKLSEFKCSKCNKFLKRSPVYLNHDKKALCSECFTPEISATQNRLYESTAQFLLFPCKYEEYGCTATVPFVHGTQEIPHEEGCLFRQYVCPVLGSNACNWSGVKDKMVCHFHKKHPQLLIKNPAILTHDFHYSNTQTYLLLAFEFIFLLHTKICINSGQILYAVRFLGDPKQAEGFAFSVIIKREESLLSRLGKVVSQDCLDIERSVSLTLSSLLNVFGGFQDICFTIALKQLKKCIRCKKFIWKIIYNDTTGCLCEKCAPRKRNCKYRSKGCTFVDVDMKCTKHELYFCQFLNCCNLCYNNVSQNSLLLHYNLNHKRNAFKTDSVYHVEETGCKGRQLISSTTICVYDMDHANIFFWFYSSIPSNRLNEFRCTVRLIRPESNVSRTFTLDLQPFTKLHDWHINIKREEFPWMRNKLDVSFEISQVVKEILL